MTVTYILKRKQNMFGSYRLLQLQNLESAVSYVEVVIVKQLQLTSVEGSCLHYQEHRIRHGTQQQGDLRTPFGHIVQQHVLPEVQTLANEG